MEKEKEHVAKAIQNNGYPRGIVFKNWTATSQPLPPAGTHPQPQ